MNNQIILSFLVSMMVVGCGGNSGSAGNGMYNNENGEPTNGNNGSWSENFESKKVNEKNIIIDKQNKLMWVNGKEGCTHINPGKEKEFSSNKAIKHCDDLTYAGFANWRVPKINEIKNLTMSAYKANYALYYEMSFCPRVVGYENSEIKHINTHNTKPVGKIESWHKKNAGIRCVRDDS